MQHGYNIGVAKTEDTLRAEDNLNWAGVESSSELRKLENIFYPSAIWAANPPSTHGEVASTVAISIEETQP